MILRLPEVIIDPHNPFVNDKLNRYEIAESLTHIFDTINHPFVFALNSPWGFGKTTFIQMWKQYLENNNYPTLYYNAWENDYCDEAFLSLFTEIESEIKVLRNSHDLQDELNDNLEKIKKIGFKLSKNLIPLIIKIASQGLIDFSDEAGAFSTAIDGLSKQIFENFEATKDNREKFKQLLSSLIDNLTKSEEFQSKSLVFFIDELDRCKPTFAIELLEKVKHFFSIDKLIFVIAIDKDQLQKSFRTVYGNEMYVDGYMRRFFDLEFTLPEPDYSIYFQHLESFFNEENLELHNINEDYGSFSDFSKLFNASLRDQNQIFLQLLLIYKMGSGRPRIKNIIPLLFFLFLKNKDFSTYSSFRKNESSLNDLIKYLTIKDSKNEFMTKWEGIKLEAYLLFFQIETYDDKINLKKYNEIIIGSSTVFSPAKDRANNVIREFNLLRQHNSTGKGTLENILKKIDMSEKFRIN